MITKTLDGTPLSEEAAQKLAMFKAMAQARQDAMEEAEQNRSRLDRKGVRVFTEAEKAAFLASRPDLKAS